MTPLDQVEVYHYKGCLSMNKLASDDLVQAIMYTMQFRGRDYKYVMLNDMLSWGHLVHPKRIIHHSYSDYENFIDEKIWSALTIFYDSSRGYRTLYADLEISEFLEKVM